MVDGLQEEVGLLVVQLQRGEPEVELQLAVERIGAIFGGLYLEQEVEGGRLVFHSFGMGSGDEFAVMLHRHHVAREGDVVFVVGERHVDVAVHAAAVEVVLPDIDGYFLNAQGPVVDGGVDDVLQTDRSRDAALVEEHVGAGNLEALVAILEQALGHHDRDILDKEAGPCVVRIELGDREVALVVANRELQVGVVLLHRQVEGDVGGFECPTWEVFVLEGIHRH